MDAKIRLILVIVLCEVYTNDLTEQVNLEETTTVSPETSTSLTRSENEIYKDKEIAKLTTVEIISFYKYPNEIHPVTTKDGYIIELHRIPNKEKPVVLLGHGLISSSSDFVLAGPKHALSFLLFNQGFDVWMINYRGNRYSRNHVALNPNMSQLFWQYSMHEHGIYDLKAAVDYILNTTGASKLSYIGHSLGAANFFVLTTVYQEYNKKFNIMVALAPAVYPLHIKSILINNLMQNIDGYNWMLLMTKSTELIPWTPNNIVNTLFSNVRTTVLNDVTGPNPELYTNDFVDILMNHNPSGTSLKTLVHIGQVGHSGVFRHYDYGAINNLKRYSSVTPPLYNLKKNSVPTVLYYSRNDNLITQKDVEMMAYNMTSVLEVNKVKDDLFNHLDFLFSKYAKELIFDHVIELVRNYSNG